MSAFFATLADLRVHFVLLAVGYLVVKVLGLESLAGYAVFTFFALVDPFARRYKENRQRMRATDVKPARLGFTFLRFLARILDAIGAVLSRFLRSSGRFFGWLILVLLAVAVALVLTFFVWSRWIF